MPLEEEQKYLETAEGFLELRLPLDVDAEFDCVDPFIRHLTEVMEVRARIYTALGKWELLIVAAKRLWDATEEPQWAAEWAHALPKSGAIESAKAVLLDAVERHPENALFHFQLACYECQLGSSRQGAAGACGETRPLAEGPGVG